MLYLDSDAVGALLNYSMGLWLSEEAFRLHSNGQVEQPLRSIIKGDEHGLMGTMPAYIKSGPYQGFGVKSVVVRLGPHTRGPSHMGSVLVYDEARASPVAAVDAGAITRVRTAAASAHATQLLAPSDASRVAILGTGLQARAHLLAMQAVRPIRHVSVWGRSEAACEAFAAWGKEHAGLPIAIRETVAEAVKDSHIICTTTAARTPILSRSELPRRCHINAIGASAPGFQELHEDVYQDVGLYTDCNQAAFAASECLIKAVRKGILPEQRGATEIGTLSADRKQTGLPDITVFKSVGLAVQDLVFAREAIRRWVATSR